MTETRDGRPMQIPFDLHLREILQNLKRQREFCPGPSKYVLDVVDLPRNESGPNVELILQAFRAARVEAGIPTGDFNSLRYTFAWNCIRKGAEFQEVSRMTDWDNLDVLSAMFQEAGRSRM